MSDEDRRLLIESIAERKELKGEMGEFREHVIERVQRLERKEVERGVRETRSGAAVLRRA